MQFDVIATLLTKTMTSQACTWEQLLSCGYLPLPLTQPFPLRNGPMRGGSQGVP